MIRQKDERTSTDSTLEAFRCYLADVALPRARSDRGGTRGLGLVFLSY